MAGAGDGAAAPACRRPADARSRCQRERYGARRGAARGATRARGPPPPPRAAGGRLLTEAAAAIVQPVALRGRAAASQHAIAVGETSELLDDRPMVFRRT